MGITTYVVSSKRGDGVEVTSTVNVNDEDIRSRDVVIRAAMRREPWYAGGDIRILESRRREEVSITRAAAGTTASELHRSALQSVSVAHALLAQHASQGCVSCHGFQPSVRSLHDTMSQSGYASQSPTAKSTMGGQTLHPALAPGEGKHPSIADRDVASGLPNGRASLAELSRLNCGDYLNLLVPVTSRRKK